MHKITFTLLIIGGLNWLLEAFGWGVGQYLTDWLAMLIYILVGLSAIYQAVTHKSYCKECSGMMKEQPKMSNPSM